MTKMAKLRPVMKTPARASLGLERFLQLAGEFIGRGIDGVLHDFRGTR